jgi:spermidine synthase
VRDYYLFSKLSKQRIAYFEDILNNKANVKINRDFQPISYFYNMAFWITYFKDSFLGKIIKSFNESRVTYLVVILFIFIMLWLVARPKNNRFIREIVLGIVMAGGFSQMTLQVIILLCFQIIYGYLFYKLGLILTFFMIGLSLGGILAIRVSEKKEGHSGIFCFIIFILSLYAISLPFIFEALRGLKTGWLYRLGADIIFPTLSLFSGLLCSLEFIFANKLYFKEDREVATSAGLIYGVDLIGSCIGALLSSLLFIPILGVFKTCFIVSGINLLFFIAFYLLYIKGGWTK